MHNHYVITFGLLAAVAGCGFLPRHRLPATQTVALVEIPRPPAVDSAFAGCDADGSPPDGFLNVRKNRVDVPPSYVPLTFDVLSRLAWPASVGYRWRNLWTRGEQRDVARLEGAAVLVEGYLAFARVEIPEAPNCYSRAASSRDYHMWLSAGPHGHERQSVVVEITPRVRVSHPTWTFSRIEGLIKAQQRVRVGGWLMLDQMHPELVRVNRATLWEIHPVMRIDVQQPDGRWVSLDSMQAPR